MNKASSLAFLIAALAGGLAGVAASWKPAPKPVPQVSEVAKASLAAGAKPRVMPETNGQNAQPAPPETTIVMLPPRTQREAARVLPPAYREREPVRLVRDLQRELRRVGCYSHDIDGDWSPATRKAMKDFTDRVNAVLPVEKPDPVHLVLVQSQPELVCRDSCADGESLSGNRCVPNSLLAAASRGAAATTPPPPQLTLVQSYDTPPSPEPDASDLPAPAIVSEAAPRPRRRPSRPGGIGSMLFGIFSW